MTRDWWQLPHRHPRVVDLTLVVVTYALTLMASTLATPNGEAPYIAHAVTPGAIGFAAVASVALLWHRRRPDVVLALATACGVCLGTIGSDVSAPLVTPALVAAYSVGWRMPRPWSRLYPLISGTVLLVTTIQLSPGSPLAAGKVTLVAGFLLTGAFAETTRSRHNYLAALQARAELAEQTREEEARHRVGEERVRIARELHDIVAHHMALAHTQASTAAYLLRTQPEHAQQILDQLAGTTSSALRELKATVGLLRRDDDPETPREPAPGLKQLPQLLASFQPMGLTVSFAVTGDPQPLSPGVDLTAYRIVQEALTNVTKHAGTATASVRLSYSRSLLTITVSDNGHTAAGHDEPGYGLIGMRERAISVGGELLAGQRQGGGFEVSTKLPLERHAPVDEYAESRAR